MSKAITIDGKNYELESLSKELQQHVLNVQVADREIGRLTIQLAMAQTARAAYGAALQAELQKLGKE